MPPRRLPRRRLRRQLRAIIIYTYRAATLLRHATFERSATMFTFAMR